MSQIAGQNSRKTPMTNLHDLLFSESQLNPPPFPYEVRGPNICPGHLYGLASRDDVDRFSSTPSAPRPPGRRSEPRLRPWSKRSSSTMPIQNYSRETRE
jgi:hypothetical protein